MTPRLKRRPGEMLVSAERGRIVEIDADKVTRGEFFTTEGAWLNGAVRKFIEDALRHTAPVVLDPFAGDGHLLELLASEFNVATEGLDIAAERWPKNDSLKRVPKHDGLIVTNPPYLARHSAKRKGVDKLVQRYLGNTKRTNLYEIALDRCLAAANYVVAIVPETFVLSVYPKDRLECVVVILDQLFTDTMAPTVVACFGPAKRSTPAAQLIFSGERAVSSIPEIMRMRGGRARAVIRRDDVVFNVPNGRIGLRAVDGASGVEPIRFVLGSEFDYPRDRVIVSSRLLTYLELPDVPDGKLPEVIERANRLLDEVRQASADLVLAPFKGNTKPGPRRRRLDFGLARQLLAQAMADSGVGQHRGENRSRGSAKSQE
jgi:hypothetical protein